MPRLIRSRYWTPALILALAAVPLAALVQPDASPLGEKTFRHDDLYIPAVYHKLSAPALQTAPGLGDELAALDAAPSAARLDARGGRWGTLLLRQPLVPGTGVGNDLRWSELKTLAPRTPAALEDAVWDAFAAYLARHQETLRIDLAELGDGRVTVHRGGDLIQIHAPRAVDGVPVRKSFVTAVVNHGNLVLWGANRWGDVDVSTVPTVALEDAVAALGAHLAPHAAAGTWGKPGLELVPTARDLGANFVRLGDGYRYRLAWVLRPTFDGDRGRWEALVDAHTGELLAFEDLNSYATTRDVIGGVLPVTNDGVAPDGVEQAGWPMPYADLTTQGAAVCGNGVCEPGGGEDCLSCAADCNGKQNGKQSNRFCCGDGDGQNPVGCSDSRCTSSGFQCSDTTGAGDTLFTDAGGSLLACVDGSVTTALAGRFMRMNDDCGAIAESTTGTVLDLGVGSGTDCNVPPGASAGNTRASRSGFFEMNRTKEMARGQLPGNAWLDEQLTSNMNINSTCNAFWNGTSVNFYRSGGGCSNTGEIAGVYVHEWGHGMDNNDANPTISNPGEGIPDVYTALRLNTSCIGRNFLIGQNCGGYGDPCLNCSGVRDIDWMNRNSQQPHGLSGPLGIDALCGSGSGTPCGGTTHCEGAAYAEAVWDLLKRDLPTLFGMDSNTAHEVATRLTYLGASPVGDWFQCTPPYGGCNADGGYLNFLAADDDNGAIMDGTPHMSAIFAAFDRHEIACDTPPVADTGCVGTPTTAPVVVATPIDRGAQISWGAVAGASSYRVFRTDGVFQCDFGKQLVGETTGTSLVDEGLRNGREYYYVVIPIGPAPSCFGPASSCTAVTAAAGANLAINAASAAVAISSGDGDEFLDNCENATLSFDVANVGTGAQTNVQITSVVSPSHPGITISNAAVSPSNLAANCDIGVGSFDVVAESGELAFNDTVEFQVTVTSDELSALGLSRTIDLRVEFAESDFDNRASSTFTYEAGVENWQVAEGTFNRTSADGGGAQGTTFYLASSANLPNQCDNVRSPVVRLSSSSTLEMYTRFDIEPFCGFPNCFPGQWFDRANVGLLDVASGDRTPVDPDGGRTYNASGAGGTCGTEGQNGWADTANSWAASTWSAGALGSGAVAGSLLQLDVRYGTDPAVEGFGFRFDQVTLTNFDLQVADAQTDACATCGDAVCDPGEDQCSCPADCGTPPLSEAGLCTDGIDNDCDGDVDCDDADCGGDPACPTSSCGDGVCDSSSENCLSCAVDCNGKQNGKPANRFCCGDGGGQNPVGCGDSRCTTGGFMCI